MENCLALKNVKVWFSYWQEPSQNKILLQSVKLQRKSHYNAKICETSLTRCCFLWPRPNYAGQIIYLRLGQPSTLIRDENVAFLQHSVFKSELFGQKYTDFFGRILLKNKSKMTGNFCVYKSLRRVCGRKTFDAFSEWNFRFQVIS